MLCSCIMFVRCFWWFVWVNLLFVWCLGELVLLFYAGGFVLNGFDVWLLVCGLVCVIVTL